MLSQITVLVNGRRSRFRPGATVAVAMVLARQACRTSVNGEPRGPLCGMGVCFGVPRGYQWNTTLPELSDSVRAGNGVRTDG